MCEGKNYSETRWNMLVCEAQGGWSCQKKPKREPDQNLVQALLETLVSNGEIKILEIHVVALQSDATVYVSCIAAKERREAVLKHWILGSVLNFYIGE